MRNSVTTPGIVDSRLEEKIYDKNFEDVHQPLDLHEAFVAADRCYFCYDAPCVTACPTDIDIPLFIRQISTGTPREAAKTILNKNILGGMCARVCPTETLCEEACVREVAEGKPVEIGKLQRFATDIIMEEKSHPFLRADKTGKKVAVIGAGPAGLACAHRLALYGHDIDLFDSRNKMGGLNEYGIAAYKSVNKFAEREVEWLLQIGGINPYMNSKLGHNFNLKNLENGYDAIFLGIGLGGVNSLGLNNEEIHGVTDAVDFISELRQTDDLKAIPIGRNVIVIGGGMTAVDAAVQAKLLGAENVTIVYRRGKNDMNASLKEQKHATSAGVRIITNVQPKEIVTDNGVLSKIILSYTRTEEKGLEVTSEEISLEADQVFRAIGQNFQGDVETSVKMLKGKILIDDEGRTSKSKIWAGGDCATGGDDLTVTAVAQGRDSAESINKFLTKV